MNLSSLINPRSSVSLFAALLTLAFNLSILNAVSQSLTINEVRTIDSESPFGDVLFPFVELYNNTIVPASTTDMRLVNNSDTEIATLPSLSVPAGAFLTIYFGTGTDDLDFSDNEGSYFTQGSYDDIFLSDDGVGLYEGPFDPLNLTDFVFWAESSTFTGNTIYSGAVANGIWTDLDYVDVSGLESRSTIGLCPDGFDNDASPDWVRFNWDYQISNSEFDFNQIQLLPNNGLVQNVNLINFAWRDVAFAFDFVIEVALDIDFTAIIHSTVTTSTSTPFLIADGVYFWRVLVRNDQGVVVNPNAYPWSVFIGSPPPPDPEDPEPEPYGKLAVPHYLQHKDSEMLCITFDNAYNPTVKRHGCEKNAGNNGPWDGKHPDNHALSCTHCNMYCARASIQMINHYHKGPGASLSQDRISYEALKNKNAGPESDLGHNRGFWNDDTNLAYGWALGTGSTYDGTITFNEMKTEIDNGRPVLVRNAHHMMVIAGYREVNGVKQIYLNDPWPTSPTGWMNWNAKGLIGWFKLTGAPAPVNQEGSVNMDTDGDGVCNFDEHTRDFCSDQDNPDTDEDGVEDLKEIQSYTFHEEFHAGHVNIAGIYIPVDDIRFPDIDQDGTRAECDCDTDGDGDHDGHEDINTNGKSPEDADETDVYDKDDKERELTTDMSVYNEDESVLLSGGSFEANKSYNYSVIEDCGTLSDGDALSNDGSVSTGQDGKFEDHDIGTFEVGYHEVVLDLNHNGIYDSQDCADITVCFEVENNGCCYFCEAESYDCVGTMSEEDCYNDYPGYTWISGAECGGASCGYGGCTDPEACNYDPGACGDDGSCYYYGCTDPEACNYDPFAGCDDGSCYYYGCTDPSACNYDEEAQCDDGSCYYYGCMDPLACNYDENAGCDDGTCYYGSCMDFAACNYDPNAQCDDGSCVYGACSDPIACNYEPNAPCEDNASCTYDICGGCLTPNACNYMPNANFDDGSCAFPGCINEQACNYDPSAGCDDGSCTFPGCTDVLACNYDVNAGCDNGLCVYPGCDDENACNYNPDAACDDGSCTYPGCLDPIACNYNVNAGCSDASCTYPGCTDILACNFDPSAGCHVVAMCTYPGCNNLLACNYDAQAGCDDGTCILPGCLDSLACNFDPGAGCPGLCTYPGCTDQSACNYDLNAGCSNGSCSFPGCNDPLALNYDDQAGCSDGSCLYDPTGCGDPLACNYVPGQTGLECIYPGCTDTDACNYQITAGCDNGTCTYPGCADSLACNFNPLAGCHDGSCVFPGCNDPAANNYNSLAGCDDGSCTYDPSGCNDPNACNYNANDTGTIDCTYPGCLDISACNYNPLAGCPDACLYVDVCGECGGTALITGCTNPLAFNYDANADCDNGTCMFGVPGCTYPGATNYDPLATIDDGSCAFENNCPSDINQDCAVDTIDLLMFLSSFGTTCIPCN